MYVNPTTIQKLPRIKDSELFRILKSHLSPSYYDPSARITINGNNTPDVYMVFNDEKLPIDPKCMPELCVFSSENIAVALIK